MVPPLKNKSVTADAPLSTWEIVNSFDTASDCENSRSALLAQAKNTANRENRNFEATQGDRSNKQNLETLNQLYFLEVVVPLQKCIASDDPRLKEN